MRKLSGAAVAMIMAIALYFTLFWGFDALRMLTSPTYGLEDVWRSQFVFAIGRLFGLAPLGLIKLAAFFATLKLAVAGICAVHIFDRLRSLVGGKADTDILEAGLMLVVADQHRFGRPGDWSHNADLVREQAIQLMLAAVAAGALHRRAQLRAPRPPRPSLTWSMELAADRRAGGAPGSRRSAKRTRRAISAAPRAGRGRAAAICRCADP